MTGQHIVILFASLVILVPFYYLRTREDRSLKLHINSFGGIWDALSGRYAAVFGYTKNIDYFIERTLEKLKNRGGQ